MANRAAMTHLRFSFPLAIQQVAVSAAIDPEEEISSCTNPSAIKENRRRKLNLIQMMRSFDDEGPHFFTTGQTTVPGARPRST